MVRREVGNEFQLYGTDNVKAREQVEWSGVSKLLSIIEMLLLTRWNMFDDHVIMLLVVG